MRSDIAASREPAKICDAVERQHSRLDDGSSAVFLAGQSRNELIQLPQSSADCVTVTEVLHKEEQAEKRVQKSDLPAEKQTGVMLSEVEKIWENKQSRSRFQRHRRVQTSSGKLHAKVYEKQRVETGDSPRNTLKPEQ